jgi:tetratricopeptide (TPR) repeat protein
LTARAARWCSFGRLAPPPETPDRDEESPRARAANAAPKNGAAGADVAGEDADDRVQGGLHEAGSVAGPGAGAGGGDAMDGPEAFEENDSYSGATQVHEPATRASLAARIDAFLASSDDDDPEEELSITGIRPVTPSPVSPTPGDADAGEVTLGPAGASPVRPRTITPPRGSAVPRLATAPVVEASGPVVMTPSPSPSPSPSPVEAIDDLDELSGEADAVPDDELHELSAETEIVADDAPPPPVVVPPARRTITVHTVAPGTGAAPPPVPRAVSQPIPPVRAGTSQPIPPPPIPKPARPTMTIAVPPIPADAPARPSSGSIPRLPRPEPGADADAAPSPSKRPPTAPVVPMAPPPAMGMGVFDGLDDRDDGEPGDSEALDLEPELDPVPSGPAASAPLPDDAPPLPSLESQLETPSAIERAVAAMGDAALERRAEELARDLDAASDKALIADLAYELGELYERRLEDEARAVKAYGRALQSDPSLRPNLWAIRRVFYRRGLWPNLIKLIDAELRFARSDGERADLFTEKGLILAEKAGASAAASAAGEARTAFGQAADLDPTSILPLLQLERLAEADGDLATLADVWTRLVAASRRPERKLVHLLDLVRLHAEQGPDGLDTARELIADAVALGVDGERVAAERLRLAELGGDVDEILSALEAQAVLLMARFGPLGAPEVPSGPRAAGAPLDRASALRLKLVAVRRRQAQVARAHREPGYGDKAWDYLQQAIALAPGEPLLIADLADLAEELGRFTELAELVESWQALEGDPARALTLSLRRADALLRGGKRDQARSLLATLEASAPGFAPITALLERDALAGGDHAALARAYAAAAEAARLGTTFGSGASAAASPAAAAALYVAAAEVWAHGSDAPGEAALADARTALGQALEVVPGYPAAVEALVELHERAGRIDEAAALLEQESERGDIGARSAVLERLARIHREHAAGDPARLAAVLDAERRLAALDPDEVRLGWRVDATLAELGRDAERIDHLADLARRDLDSARRGLALSTAARLADDRGDRDRALELFRATLAVWPDDRYSRESIIELLRDAGRWDELVAERRAEAADQAGDDPAALRALREAAWLLEDRLGRPADAAGVWREILDRAPDPASSGAVHAAALAGLVRTAAASGDDDALVAALDRALDGASGDAAIHTALRLGATHERAGRSDDAAEAYRRALALIGTPGSGSEAGQGRGVAAAVAAAALLDLAAERADTAARIDAGAELARVTVDTGLTAALHEDTGWLYALVLEDFDRAAVAFTAAAAADPARPGPLLGVALVAARRGEQAELATAYERLASATSMPEAASALRLRAAAIAAAGSEPELAAARVSAARQAAPDDIGALVVAAEYAPPPTAPGKNDDVQAAIDQLLARAEVLEMRAALADDPAARISWELDRAEALEAAGRLKEAGAVVAAVLRSQPDDLRALESLRRLARRGGDRPTWARASLALARVLGDRAATLTLLREAAAIFDPSLPQTEGAPAPTSGAYGADPAAAVAVYRRILAEDPAAVEFVRVCTLYRQHGDIRGLALAIADRLTWIDGGGADPAAAVPLLLERARLRSALGDGRGASADLEDLVRRDPQHAEALSLLADTALALGDAGRAVDLWRAYLAAETIPERRGEAELTLARILAEDMNDVTGAIEQLERVVATSPHDLPLREKLVGLCTRAQDWGRVARELREITRLRPTPGEKAREELRLAEILRDKLNDHAAARAAFERARQLDPLHLDAVSGLAALVTGRDDAARTAVFAAAAGDLRTALSQAPARAALHERLATVAGWQGDADGRWLALVAVEAVGSPSADQRAIIATGRERHDALPRQRLSSEQVGLLRPPGEEGITADLWRAMAPAVTAAVAVDPGKLGFTRADRIAMKALGKKHEALAAVLAGFGVEEADVYVAESRAGVARVLSGETPVLCLGADIAAGGSREARFQLGRIAFQAADGTGTLTELREAEVAWYFAAALLAAEVRLPPLLAEVASAEHAAVGERARVVGKHLARRDKKTIQGLGPRVADVTDPVAWRRAALAAAHRAGLLLAGDLAVALAALDVGRNARAIADSPAALDLLAWSVSQAHVDLRRELGGRDGGRGGSKR